MGLTDQQVLKVLYQWGGEASKSTIEDNLQVILGKELIELKGKGLIHLNGTSVVLTFKGVAAVESANLVTTQTMVDSNKARDMVKRALKSVLDHDLTGYNVIMQEAKKAFPVRFISAIEKFYSNNLP